MIKQGYEQEFIICLKSLYLGLNKSPCEMTHILSNYKIFPDTNTGFHSTKTQINISFCFL